MSFAYRSVDTSSLAGLEKAERLHARGWKVISAGLYRLVFERKIS